MAARRRPPPEPRFRPPAPPRKTPGPTAPSKPPSQMRNCASPPPRLYLMVLNRFHNTNRVFICHSTVNPLAQIERGRSHTASGLDGITPDGRRMHTLNRDQVPLLKSRHAAIDFTLQNLFDILAARHLWIGGNKAVLQFAFADEGTCERECIP